MARRCQHPFISPKMDMLLDDRIYTAAAICHILPVERTLLFWTLLSPAPFPLVHACCLRSRFGRRGHYSLWGAKLGQGKATGILHDWPSAPELLTRSDKSFHSGLDACATVASQRSVSQPRPIYLEYHLLLRLSILLGPARTSVPVGNDHNTKACPSHLSISPVSSPCLSSRPSSSHMTRPSANKPLPDLSHHAPSAP